MNKLIQRLLSLAICLCVIISAHADETIRITNGEWPPYMSRSLKHHGAVSHIVSEAFALEGINVKYGFFPWTESLALARNNQWDGTAVWLSNPERQESFYFSDPVITGGYVFFHLKTMPFDWHTINDLKGYVIGATSSYDYGYAFTQAEVSKQITVQRVPIEELNFAKLIHGKIQLLPSYKEVGLTMLKKHFTPEEVATVTYHALPLRDEPMYLLLSKKNPGNAERMAKFNRGLKKLNDQGKVELYLKESHMGGYEK